MRARSLRDLLKKSDRIAVSNITGREASKVSQVSQRYCGNVVAGWALGKGGQAIDVPGKQNIKVFGQFEELMANLPEGRKPNKVIVYSPPDAVYGDVKEVIEHGKGQIETIFVITEHVSIEVTAKLRQLAGAEGLDIIGCNTLGTINVHDRVRVGAVGGNEPDETFVPGSACVISNSGNMVNTIAGYLQSAGLGVSCGISTGKDVLILTPLKDMLELAHRDRRTKMIVLYVEPGGVYEEEAVAWLANRKTTKPILVYVAGRFAEGKTVSLGHAGAVVEGPNTSASAKMKLFDDFFGTPAYDPQSTRGLARRLAGKKRGVRVKTLHDLVPAAAVVMSALEIKRDFMPKHPLTLKPWLVGLGAFAHAVPRELVPHAAHVPAPYGALLRRYVKEGLGRAQTRQNMRNASHASSNDGTTPRIYGHSLLKMMDEGSFARSVLLYWLGTPVAHDFEVRLFEMCLMASLTNGPGTISAQAAKLSAAAGNEPNAAMMATLGSIGTVHGGNGKRAARLLIDVFGATGLTDPYAQDEAPDLDRLARQYVSQFKKAKAAAKDAGVEYEKVPCLGHPVFNTKPVNYDPRERVISAYMEQHKLYNVFLDFYHRLSRELMAQQATNKIHAVNVDAVIACVCMGIAWPLLVDKKVTIDRAVDLPFLAFALGRVAGGAGEYLDHRDTGTAMDMRVPVSECRFIGREQD